MTLRRFFNLSLKNDSLRSFLIASSGLSSSSSGALSSYLQQSATPYIITSPCISSGRQCTALRFLHHSACVAAGHSKWHNIKHIKAANDRERATKSNFLAHKIQQVLNRNPISDPKLNTELANLIKWARSNNIPNDTIDKTIDRQVKLRDPKNITSFSGRGPANTGIVIECFSLKPEHTKGLLQSIVKKAGFSLNTPADDLFDHKGIIDVELPEDESSKAQSDPSSLCIDKYIDMAIEVGAEDVTLENDGEKLYLQFTCGPYEVPRVSKGLEESGLTIVSEERCYVPKISVPVSSQFLEALDKVTEKLEIQPDVIKYHFNVEPES